MRIEFKINYWPFFNFAAIRLRCCSVTADECFLCVWFTVRRTPSRQLCQPQDGRFQAQAINCSLPLTVFNPLKIYPRRMCLIGRRFFLLWVDLCYMLHGVFHDINRELWSHYSIGLGPMFKQVMWCFVSSPVTFNWKLGAFWKPLHQQQSRWRGEEGNVEIH